MPGAKEKHERAVLLFQSGRRALCPPKAALADSRAASWLTSPSSARMKSFKTLSNKKA